MGQEIRQPVPRQQTREGQTLAAAVEARATFSRNVHDSGKAQGADVTGELEVVIAAGGTVVVQHQLGHEPTGWRIIDRNRAGSVWRIAQDRESLTLQTDAALDITIKVEVF